MPFKVLLAGLELPVELGALMDLVHPSSNRHGLALLLFPLRETSRLLLLPTNRRSELLPALTTSEHALHAFSLVQVSLVTACEWDEAPH